jgi:colanic acid/amylovoran biosynthesis glycosyltransferase
LTTEEKDRVSADVRKKIVYIIGTYPDLTKTFIDREILEAKRAGLDISIIATRGSGERALPSQVQRLMEEIQYLVPVSAFRLGRAHINCLRRYFGPYLRTLFFLITRHHPSLKARIKTVLHFGGGVLAADYLRRGGIPSHIHAHFADGAAVIAMTINRLLGVPFSLTAHAFDIYRSPVFLEEKIAQARFVTTCTTFNRHHLERLTGRRIKLIYHGVDFAAVRAVGMPDDKLVPPLILSVGRLQEKKGFTYLIEACARLKQQGYDFSCEIVGEGPEKENLLSRIGELELQDKVTLSGALPNSDVLVKYSRAAVFALPCCVTESGDRDGIPNVILEAMAFGLPVVSTDVSGVPEVVQHGVTGMLVESRNVEALSLAIGTLLSDPDEASRLGRSASEFVSREFDIRRNVDSLIRLFEQ